MTVGSVFFGKPTILVQSVGLSVFQKKIYIVVKDISTPNFPKITTSIDARDDNDFSTILAARLEHVPALGRVPLVFSSSWVLLGALSTSAF